jgi:alkanesulfonate monooxygenase SsuD/methylene tetrahydromethanopterin reductase-like flavin-dependent oxidoreductase (luciferase family)
MTHTFGLDTFGDRNSDADGKPLSHAQTIRNVVEEGVFAEQAGVDFFGIGEHHTDYFPMPAGDVALAAIAARTERIRLGSAVTVLSSDDPVRVFQRYSTLNAISGGRAEVVLGRGSSRCLATTSPTTRNSSRRRPHCSRSCSRAGRSPGTARPARPC